jgi:transposase InsO family protein
MPTVAFLAEEIEAVNPTDCLNVENENNLQVEIKFAADSGCNKFMIRDKKSYSSMRKLEKVIPITLADGSTTDATHVGTVDLVTNYAKRVTFKDVLYVPGLRRNLLSIRKIALGDFEVVFMKNSVEIRAENGVVIASGHVENDLYFINFSICSAETGSTEADLTYAQLHRRLGHLNANSIQLLKKQGLVDFSGDTRELCESCVYGKQTQLPYLPSAFKTKRPLEQIVSDVCYSDVTSFDGYDYFLTFLDDYTHFSAVYLLKEKSEVFSKLVEYKAMATAQFGTKISSLYTDNGGEYVSSELIEWCKKKGIQTPKTMPYNHQQAGKAERLNQSLLNRARTMLDDSGLPKRFWSEAILCANYILNRCPTRSTGKIPAFEWNRHANYQKLRPFGCVCYAHVPKEKRKKFDRRSIKGIMVGYAPTGYRIYDLEKQKVIEARNVLFDEGKFYKDLFSTDYYVGARTSKIDNTEVRDESSDINDILEENDDPQEFKVRRSGRVRTQNVRLKDYELGSCEALFTDDLDPKWEEPKIEEMNIMQRHGVWELVPRTSDMKVMRSKWVLQEKPNKLKARLVAVGCDEKDVPDELFSPVVNMTTVKIMLCLAVQLGFKLDQMDVSSAFLHGDLDYDAYMEQPKGFCKDKTLVCRLLKAIYGLKVAPRIWNQCFDKFMVSIGFVRSSHDYCLYSRKTENFVIYVLVHVDDVLIASNSGSLISFFKQEFSKQFSVKDLGKINRYLGMKICYNEVDKVMTIGQTDFITKVAKRFDVLNAKSINLKTPIEKDLNLMPAEKVNVRLPYRQLVGCLLYVSICSRPDISFAVNYLSRFMNSYSDLHFQYLKRVLIYLYNTRDLKLTYTFSNENKILQCFVDADWASDKLTRKSVSGSVVKLFGNVILWSSKKQSCITLSSTESEYVSLSTFVHDSLLWLLGILKDLNVSIVPPVLICEDNQSVISLSENPLMSKRSKHIDVRYKYLKELVLDGEIKLVYTPTELQLADILTKGLVICKFEKFQKMLNIK